MRRHDDGNERDNKKRSPFVSGRSGHTTSTSHRRRTIPSQHATIKGELPLGPVYPHPRGVCVRRVDLDPRRDAAGIRVLLGKKKLAHCVSGALWEIRRRTRRRCWTEMGASGRFQKKNLHHSNCVIFENLLNYRFSEWRLRLG